MVPLVSICIPNLNTRPYLKERFESIFNQTFHDWELFVYDGFSDDGSWELIQKMARQEARMRITQGPRQGAYPAWNECIRQTRGEYVYIATSDDSMAPDFLEKMVEALHRHPDCQLAHSRLVITNETGGGYKDASWPECTVFADGVQELVHIPHIRRAPYDGLIQLTGRHSVLSITQLLIRRSIFARIGYFSDRWGSQSDFHWEMKAGLLTNTVYVPDTWATWRIHSAQATQETRATSLDAYFSKVELMIRDAVSECERDLHPVIARQLKGTLLDRSNELRTYYLALRQLRDDGFGRSLYQLKQLLTGPNSVRRELGRRVLGRSKWNDRAAPEIRLWLESLGLQPITLCPPAASQSGGAASLPKSAGATTRDVSNA